MSAIRGAGSRSLWAVVWRGHKNEERKPLNTAACTTPTTIVYASLRCDHEVELWIFTEVAPCAMHHGGAAEYYPTVSQLVPDGITQPCAAVNC